MRRRQPGLKRVLTGKRFGRAHRRPAAVVILALLAPAVLSRCQWRTPRAACARDGDCGAGAMCMPDGLCLPTGVASRSGAKVGNECNVTGSGSESGCAEGAACRMGWCARLPDTTRPTFAGVVTATAPDSTTVQLCWAPGSDDATPATELVYDVYESTRKGSEDFLAPPRSTTTPGASCATMTALSPSQQACWVVRARDLAGNRDANTGEQCVTLPALPPGCVSYAASSQPLFDRHCVRCHAGAAAAQWLRLDSYEHVLAGGVRRSAVRACDPAASLLLDAIGAAPRGGRRMPSDGPPYLTAAQINMVSQWILNGAQRLCSEPPGCDSVPPTFAGATSATAIDATTVRVCWAEATDPGTEPRSIRYDLYQSSAPAPPALAGPPQEAVVGVPCADVKVGPSVVMCFVVRARDPAGNVEANTVEVCATTAAATCAIEFGELIQPILTARCAHCHRGAGGAGFLDLSSFAGLAAGGAAGGDLRACDPATSLLTLKAAGEVCGRRMPADGPPYLSLAERNLLKQWILSGGRQYCSEPSPCGDATAPTFAGLSSVTAVDPTSIKVCWAPATDDTAPSSAISYDLYEAEAAGGEKFASPPSYTAPAGSSCLTVGAPAGAQTCFVVRARDPRGNRDGNAVEKCVTTSAGCVDYQSRVQALFNARCVHCHTGAAAPGGGLDTYANLLSKPGQVRACDAPGSKLVEVTARCTMPSDTSGTRCPVEACLTPSQQRLLSQWINQRAPATCPGGICP